MNSSAQQRSENSVDSSDMIEVEKLLRRIRAQVSQSIQNDPQAPPRYRPPAAAMFDGNASPILYSDELNYLNAHWHSWSESEQFSSHRPVIGRILVGIKRRLRSYFADTLFRSYFERERQFQMNLVRYLNASARYIDARDSALFWQLVHKADSDIEASNERSDKVFYDLHGTLSTQIRELSATLRTHQRTLQRLEERAAPSAGKNKEDLLVSVLQETPHAVLVYPRQKELSDLVRQAGKIELDSLHADSSAVDVLLSAEQPGAALGELVLAQVQRVIVSVPASAALERELRERLAEAGFSTRSVSVGSAELERMPLDLALPYGLNEAIDGINRNIDRLNQVLFTSVRCYLIAERNG